MRRERQRRRSSLPRRPGCLDQRQRRRQLHVHLSGRGGHRAPHYRDRNRLERQHVRVLSLRDDRGRWWRRNTTGPDVHGQHDCGRLSRGRGLHDDDCALREAIAASNAAAGPNTIEFDITGSTENLVGVCSSRDLGQSRRHRRHHAVGRPGLGERCRSRRGSRRLRARHRLGRVRDPGLGINHFAFDGALGGAGSGFGVGSSDDRIQGNFISAVEIGVIVRERASPAPRSAEVAAPGTATVSGTSCPLACRSTTPEPATPSRGTRSASTSPASATEVTSA